MISAIKTIITILSILTAPYYLCLDIWGIEWKWVANYKDVHMALFIFLVGIECLGSLFVAFFSFFSKTKKDFSSEILDCFDNVVQLKKKRFLNKLNDIAPNSNIFKIITHPYNQIQQSSMVYCNMISEIFGIEKDDVDITIIDCLNSKFFFQNRNNMKHTDPVKILSEKSAALYCKNRGIPIYISDKEKGEKNGAYYMSDSDRTKLPGSAFCYPVFVKGKIISAEYIITISTYGKKFSDSPFAIDRELTEKILKNIAERIELELELNTIRGFMEEYKKKKE